jgi:methylated-DNA-[protein]-cysteine S-methyltransferase
MNTTEAETDGLDRLRGRLADTAAKEGLLDVSYTVLDSPVGPLLLAATDQGLVRVAYEIQDHDEVLDSLAQTVGPRVLRAPRQLDETARQLDDYFNGTRRSFDLRLDLRLTRGFRRQVQEHLTAIGYGHTQSYGDVARALGNAKAVRAVGTACATNPIPIVLPCHRVLRADGSLGGYIGGLAAKDTLLTFEMRT